MYIHIETSDFPKKKKRRGNFCIRKQLEQKPSASVSSYIIYTICNIPSYRSMGIKYSKTLHACF